MANKDVPGGAVPVGPVLRASEWVASGAIYPGDFVSQESGGRVAAASASAALCGVALTYASGAGEKVMVADDPNQRFEVQADETEVDAQTDIGLNYNIVATAANTTYKCSRMELDSSTQATTATLPLKLLGIQPRVDNALGAQVKCIVKINNHQLGSSTGTDGV